MRAQSAVVQAPTGRLLCEGGLAVVPGGVAVVDKQFVVPVFAAGRTGFAGVNIQPAVAVDVGYRYTGRPHLPGAQAGFFSNIFKVEITAVQVKAVGDHVTAHKHIRQAVVIHVADTDTAAVVKIAEEVTVERVGIRYVVSEADPGLFGVEQGEAGFLRQPRCFIPATRSQQ